MYIYTCMYINTVTSCHFVRSQATADIYARAYGTDGKSLIKTRTVSSCWSLMYFMFLISAEKSCSDDPIFFFFLSYLIIVFAGQPVVPRVQRYYNKTLVQRFFLFCFFVFPFRHASDINLAPPLISAADIWNDLFFHSHCPIIILDRFFPPPPSSLPLEIISTRPFRTSKYLP